MTGMCEVGSSGIVVFGWEGEVMMMTDKSEDGRSVVARLEGGG